MTTAPPRSLLGPALVASATTVALQIVLSRVFSVVLWYHLGFFAVGLAMLGGTIGAFLVHRTERRAVRSAPEPALAVASGLLAIALVVVLRLPVDPRELTTGILAPTVFVASTLLLAAPFIALGVANCATLASAGSRVGAVYALTFLGGALGALGAYFGMESIGAPRVLGVLILLPLCGAARATFSGIGLTGLVLGVGALAAPDEMLPTRSTKHFPRLAPEQVLAERWNASSRVTFYENPERHGLWDVAGRVSGPLPESIGVAIDAWAITSILSIRTPSDRVFFQAYPPTLAYRGTTPGFSTLVIGAGGGVDVEAALDAGAGHVTAVEINPLIVDAVRNDYREWSNDLYGRDDVEVVIGEGRHFAETATRTFDRIVATGVDTFAASEAGAFALSENYLYTLEAMKAWFARLAPDGRLTFTRWWYEPPRQTLRLLLTIDQALRELGVSEPRARMFVARSALNSVVVVKNGDFTPAEVADLESGLAPRGLARVLAPGSAAGDPRFLEFLDPARRSAAVESWDYRVAPCTDDQPFFFEYTKLSRLFATEGDWIHDRLGGTELLILTLVALLILGLPVGIATLRTQRGAGSVVPLVACVLLGLGYMLVEAPLLSRLALLLGHPGRAITVVLIALLLGSGLGAFASARLDAARAPRAALAAAALVSAILGLGHTDLVEAVRGAATGGRVVAVWIQLAVPAFVLGLPFPLALRAAGASSTTIAAATVWNGLGSALGGPLAALLSIQLGFTHTIYCGAACYLLAAPLLAVTARANANPNAPCP